MNITDKINKYLNEAKKENRYEIITTRNGKKPHSLEGSLSELIKSFSYTLEKGASWQHEKGNKKINTNPKTIKSLVKNLYNASNNAAKNGYSGIDYEYKKL